MRSASDTTAVATTQCGDGARRVIEQLGSRMRRVSLLAPSDVASRAIADAYSDLVTPALLAEWQKTPSKAPGRETSNPWPARVEVDSMSAKGGECHVDAHAVYVTTADTNTAVERRRITASLRDSSGWRVSDWENAPVVHGVSEPSPTSGDTTSGVGKSGDRTGATAVVRRYFALLAAQKYDSAYALWSDSGRASHKSRAEFVAGYRETATVRATITGAVRVEGAAGSQYATVPVAIDAVLRDGRHQHFDGTYTLRRAMVDGASAEQRSWRIYSATMREGRLPATY